MKIDSRLLRNETVAAAVLGAAGFVVWVALAALLASRLQTPIWL